ncbi:restriction endonuclease-like protein [Clostridium grantii]|uniref:DUF2357 domain-containing protein n=1 Tax=Clostridium grantii DSM 8605 TaxID=1121316 RepID=A0A1M5VGP1_9CLOT|nr:restriction endonuclease-like protein [Clostridium grantii]SHH74407.1 hypothetical protein SAMN02745207_02296 [Clostridium grantii DSM 8605]
MDLQPSGNKKRELLKLETKKIYITISGKDNLNFSEEQIGFTHVILNDEIINKDTGSGYFYENQNYEFYLEIIDDASNHKIEINHQNPNIRNSITAKGKSKRVFTGNINFGNEIGYSDIIILMDGREYINITLEVFPSKMDYKKDYKEIMTDINEEIYNLAFDFLKKTYLNRQIDHRMVNSLTEYYSILNYVYRKMMDSIKVIIQYPHHTLEKQSNIKPYHKIKKVNNEMIKWLGKRPFNLIETNGEYLPIKAMEVKKINTFDTNENRFLKYMLKSIIIKLKEIKKRYKELMRKEDEMFLSKVDSMINELNGVLNNSFLKNVSEFKYMTPSSLVFRMASGYKEVYGYYLMLKKGLSLKGDIFRISMKDLSLLYEYWCFIKINSLFKKKYKLIKSDIIKVNREGVFVTLKKGHTAEVKYQNLNDGEIFTVSYNSKENSKTVGQKPDNVLSITKKTNGEEIVYKYIFDAKYKIDQAIEGTSYKNQYKTPGPTEVDINTMHRYRDAIVFENKENKYINKNVFGAYVLFPYNNEEEYKNHRFYKTIEEVNIGGIPFLPSSTNLMEEFLKELIEETSLSAYERTIEQIGGDLYPREEDFTRRNVLIGTLKNVEQLKINVDNNFYHTNLKNVNLVKNAVEYIAISQSKKLFGEEVSGISYVGKVSEIKIVKRSEIVEIPKKNDELYVRFEVEKWEKRDKKIRIEDFNVRKIMYTSKFLLDNVERVAELRIRDLGEYRELVELKRKMVTY